MWRPSFAVAMIATMLGWSPGTGQMTEHPRHVLQTAAHFNETTTGLWSVLKSPEITREPVLDDLVRWDPTYSKEDFGLSFNCAVRRNGSLGDCRPLYSTPETLDKTGLVAVLARAVRLSVASAALARQNAYRVTIDVGAMTYDNGFGPRTCTAPFCMVEGMVPPPPPVASDPVVAAAVAKAKTCFESTWDPSTKLRFAAEKALQDKAGGQIDAADRQLALDYVKSRHAIAACAMELEDTSRKLPLTPADRKAVDFEVNAIRGNYVGQTRFALAILIGLLDRHEADFERSIPF
jgi:hypothetical protein